MDINPNGVALAKAQAHRPSAFFACLPDGASGYLTQAGLVVCHPEHAPRFIPTDKLSPKVVENCLRNERFKLAALEAEPASKVA